MPELMYRQVAGYDSYLQDFCSEIFTAARVARRSASGGKPPITKLARDLLDKLGFAAIHVNNILVLLLRMFNRGIHNPFKIH